MGARLTVDDHVMFLILMMTMTQMVKIQKKNDALKIN